MADLKPWQPGDPLSASHLQEPVDALNRIRQQSGGALPVGLPVWWKYLKPAEGEYERHICQIVDHGPNYDSSVASEDDDTRTDNTYWLKIQVPDNDLTAPHDGGGGDYAKMSLSDEDSVALRDLIVLGTNVGEESIGCHSLRAGMVVEVLAIDSRVNGGLPAKKFYFHEAPRTCYGVLQDDWTDGSNQVVLTVCKSESDDTPVYAAPYTAMPDVTCNIVFPVTATPHNLSLTAGQIVAFEYDNNNTEGHLLPVLTTGAGGGGGGTPVNGDAGFAGLTPPGVRQGLAGAWIEVYRNAGVDYVHHRGPHNMAAQAVVDGVTGSVAWTQWMSFMDVVANPAGAGMTEKHGSAGLMYLGDGGSEYRADERGHVYRMTNGYQEAGSKFYVTLLDLSIAGLTDGQFLQYDQASGKWKNVDGTVSLTVKHNGSVVVSPASVINTPLAGMLKASATPGGTASADLAIQPPSGGGLALQSTAANVWVIAKLLLPE